MRYMLDTHVAIHAMRYRRHAIRHRLPEVRAKFIARQERTCISTVSLMELIPDKGSRVCTPGIPNTVVTP